MSQNAAAADRRTLSTRSGTSRKLLARNAAEARVGAGDESEALEDAFPAADANADPDSAAPADEAAPAEPATDAPASNIEPADDAPALPAPAPAAGPESASLDAPAPASPQLPAATPAWSSEDESALQALLARRKAAGYQRRGRDVSGQLIRAGEIKPNPNTVVAVIVGLVAERGSVGRAELIELMAGAAFPHGKARPADKGWCQGYVAGAIRSGFLAVEGEAPGDAGDTGAGADFRCEGSRAGIADPARCEPSLAEASA